MSVYSDFVAFVDDGSLVPYFAKNVKYRQKPNVISAKFTYDFKDYYKSYNDYYVGVSFSQFVRKITAQDFNMMRELYEKKEKLSLNIHTQLVFDF